MVIIVLLPLLFYNISFGSANSHEKTIPLEQTASNEFKTGTRKNELLLVEEDRLLNMKLSFNDYVGLELPFYVL